MTAPTPTWWSQSKDGAWKRWDRVSQSWVDAPGPPPASEVIEPAPPQVEDPWAAADRGTSFRDFVKSGDWRQPLSSVTRRSLLPARRRRDVGPLDVLAMLAGIASLFVLLMEFWVGGYEPTGEGGVLWQPMRWRFRWWPLLASGAMVAAWRGLRAQARAVRGRPADPRVRSVMALLAIALVAAAALAYALFERAPELGPTAGAARGEYVSEARAIFEGAATAARANIDARGGMFVRGELSADDFAVIAGSFVNFLEDRFEALRRLAPPPGAERAAVLLTEAAELYLEAGADLQRASSAPPQDRARAVQEAAETRDRAAAAAARGLAAVPEDTDGGE